jgi:hypothetical protein
MCYWILNDFILPVAHEYKDGIIYNLRGHIKMAGS